MQLDRSTEAERLGAVPEEDPRTLQDDRGNFAIMHAILRGNNAMASLLDAYDSHANTYHKFPDAPTGEIAIV